jgi:hypothetical protein
MKVERGNFSHFLGLYGRQQLPSGGRLRRMMGTIIFAIEGYDADPREIYTIPEVRSFYRAFWEAWPYWFYFTCLLENDALKPMTLCCLDELSTAQVDRKAVSFASLDVAALDGFMKKGFESFDQLAEEAGLFQPDCDDQSALRTMDRGDGQRTVDRSPSGSPDPPGSYLESQRPELPFAGLQTPPSRPEKESMRTHLSSPSKGGGCQCSRTEPLTLFSDES